MNPHFNFNCMVSIQYCVLFNKMNETLGYLYDVFESAEGIISKCHHSYGLILPIPQSNIK